MEAKLKVFAVKPKGDSTSRFVAGEEDAFIGMRMVRAKRVSQVEAHIARDFEIAVATPDDLHAAGKQDIAIEDATD